MSVQSPTPELRLAARERPRGLPVMRQRWSDLLFLHWQVDAALISEQLPAGLHVDTHDGSAWLGVVPFFMDRIRPVAAPPLPWLSWFMELNLRTYVHDSAGNPGVWFFSLDCNQSVAVEIARSVFHLPYQHAKMTSTRDQGRISYSSHRKTPDSRNAEFEYSPPSLTHTATEGSLEWFLVERYLLFSTNPSGGLFCGRVHHAPYQINPLFLALRSGHPLFQRPSPQKQIPSNMSLRELFIKRWDVGH